MPDFDDAHLLELLDLAFDAVCARRAAEVVDPGQLLAALDSALAPERVAAAPGRLVPALRARLLARAAHSGVKLGVWLPPDVTAHLGERLGQPVRIPRRAIDELVASEQVRDTVRTSLQEALSALVAKLTPLGAGAGLGGGLRDALGWGARAAAAASKGLLGQLGGGIPERVREVIDGSMAMVQRRIAERLASEDTARALGARRRQLFLNTLEKTEAEAARVLERAEMGQLDPLLPRILAHNLARPEVRAGLLAEARVTLEELSRRTLGELLEQAGLREPARQALHAHGLPIARALVRSAPFRAWWARVGTAHAPD